MRNLLLALTLFVFTTKPSGYSQVIIPLVDETFAVSDSHAVYLDSLSADTLWQIGHPQKVIFNSAYSAPLAIVTDTMNPYPPNTLACFYVDLIPPDSVAWYFDPFRWFGPCSQLIIKFKHRFHCDSLTEGAWVEISSDSGDTFINLINNDLTWMPDMGLNFYSSQPIINDSIPGFTGNSGGWVESAYTIWGMLAAKAANNHYVLKFCFLSDGDSTGKDGWMVDDIEVYIEDWSAVCSGIQESGFRTLPVFPNPAQDWIYIHNTYGNNNLTGTLLDLSGCVVRKNIHLTAGNTSALGIIDLPKGVYVLRVPLPDGVVFTEKIIKQ